MADSDNFKVTETKFPEDLSIKLNQFKEFKITGDELLDYVEENYPHHKEKFKMILTMVSWLGGENAGISKSRQYDKLPLDKKKIN